MTRLRGFPRSVGLLDIPKEPELLGSKMLRHKVEIYVPTNNPEQLTAMETTMKLFAGNFGGVTVIPVIGGRIMKDGTLVMDNISIVSSFVNAITQSVRKLVRLEAVRIRDTLGEEAVTVTLDGAAEFV